MLTIRRSISTIAQVYRTHNAPVTPITLSTILKYQSEKDDEKDFRFRLLSAQRIHKEVPIRLARRIVDLESLPHGLAQDDTILELKAMLLSSFERMFEAPLPLDAASETAYMDLSVDIRSKHASMHNHVQKAMTGLSVPLDDVALQTVLDDFYQSRIDIRLLMDQHFAWKNENENEKTKRNIGMVEQNGLILPLVTQVIEDLNMPVTVKCSNENISLLYLIPSHLQIMLTEMLIFAHHHAASPQDVSLTLAGGPNGVAVKVLQQRRIRV